MKKKVLINSILLICISTLIGVTYYYISSNNLLVTIEHNEKNNISNFGNYNKKDKQTIFYVDEEENNVSVNITYFENQNNKTNDSIFNTEFPVTEESIINDNNTSNTTETSIENNSANYDNESVSQDKENNNQKDESNKNALDKINIKDLNQNLINVLHKNVNGKEITIEDTSKGDLAQAIEYYYKDYYFNCIKSQYVIVTVNNKKYNIKEALNNNIVTMNELIEVGFKPMKKNNLVTK